MSEAIISDAQIKAAANKIKAQFNAAKHLQSVQRLTDMLDEAYITGKLGDKDLLDYRLGAVLADMWFDGYNRGMDWRKEK